MEWKLIEGFEGRFSVSSEGDVRQNWRYYHNGVTKEVRRVNTNKVLTKHVHRLGYLRAHLCGKMYYIHRLVASAFLENPNNLTTVNHKNEDKMDNTVDNLEWMTHQNNVEYSQARYFTIKDPNGVVHEVKNLTKFCRENNLTRSAIQLVLKRTRPHHKNWTL